MIFYNTKIMPEKNKNTIDIKKLLEEITIADAILLNMIKDCLAMWEKSNNKILMDAAEKINKNLDNKEYKRNIFDIIKEASAMSGFIISLDKKYDIFKDPDIFLKPKNEKEKFLLKKEILTRGISINKSIIRVTKMSTAVINFRKEFYLSF